MDSRPSYSMTLQSQQLTIVVFALLLLLVSPGQAAKKPVTVEVASALPPPSPGMPIWAPDGKRFVFTLGRKVSLYEVEARSERDLFSLEQMEGSAKKRPPEEAFAWENRRVQEERIQWSPDGRNLLVAAGGDLFWKSLDGEGFRQLTSTPEPERDPKLSPDGTRISFRRDHDLYVLGVASGKVTRLTRDGAATFWNAQLDWVYPEELDLGTAHWWSPDSRRIAHLQFDVSKQQIYPHADLLKRDVVFEPQRHPKAGTPNANVRLGVVPASGGRTKWLSSVQGGDALLARVYWLPDSKEIGFVRLNRLQNSLELQVAGVGNGRTRTVLKEEDANWIDLGPDVVFLKQSPRFVWTSVRTGYRHLHLGNLDGTLLQLTRGDWEVTSVDAVDAEQGLIYYVSTEQTPLERHLYVIDFEGKNKRRLTTGAGVHMISSGYPLDSADHNL